MSSLRKKRPPRKPAKPSRGFPLFAHAAGVWAKKIRGKLHYFGPWSDPAGALAKWERDKEALLAGRTPRVDADGLTMHVLANHFMAFKKTLLDSGELTARTFGEYHATCARMLAQFGRERLVDDIVAHDFQKLRTAIAKQWGPVRLGNEIQRVRSVFRYGYDAGLIDKPIRFGPGFKKPSAKVLRQARAAAGPRLFTPEQVKALLACATVNGRAMILLGLNGGLGTGDVAELPLKALDLKAGWLDFPRGKTGIMRHIPLWSETVEAIRASLSARPKPKAKADAERVFLGTDGSTYQGRATNHRVANEFARIAKKAHVEDRTFYDCRRLFQTVAEGSRDLPAVQSIMGHAAAASDMSAVYRQTVDDTRLRAVVDFVRGWLFGKQG